MQNTATLFLNAPLPPEQIMNSLLQKIDNSYIICADGGYIYAKELPLNIDMVIGDLDTVNEKKITIHADVEIVNKPSQDLNDFEKALIWLKDKGFKKIILFGLTGERTDHVLANLSVLSRYLPYFEFEIYGQEAKVYFLSGENDFLEFTSKSGCAISLIALTKAHGITSSGLKYPLNNMSLEWGIKEGSSNEAVQQNIQIRIDSGVLAVFENYL